LKKSKPFTQKICWCPCSWSLHYNVF